MKIRFSLIFVTVLISLALIGPSFAKDAPWLEGVTIGPHPAELSPIVPMKIYMENGEAIPATLTEDIPITVVADTSIFEPYPPAEYKGQEIPSPSWMRNAAISWFFVDWEANKNTPASTTYAVAVNQMVVTPLNPTGKGAITCYAGRKMRYQDPESGTSKGTFVNSSAAKDVRVLDITPPTCGLEVSVKGGANGTFWVAENPPNKYPLPKLADVYFTGALVKKSDPEEVLTVQGLELGSGMVVVPDQVAITVPADSVLILKVNGGDNYKLDNNKLKMGICAGAGGEPTPISPVNQPEINLAELNMPDEPYLYVDATDLAGNRQVLFVPLKVK